MSWMVYIIDYFARIFYGHIVLMQNHGFKCIAKEADLTRELLRRDAHPTDDELISQGTTIRMCALSLMNCARDNSVSASAVMLVRTCLQKPT